MATLSPSVSTQVLTNTNFTQSVKTALVAVMTPPATASVQTPQSCESWSTSS